MGDVDRLTCDGCGRSFGTIDGPAMLAALKGPCPDCGGQFQLDGKLPADAPAEVPAAEDDLASPNELNR